MIIEEKRKLAAVKAAKTRKLKAVMATRRKAIADQQRKEWFVIRTDPMLQKPQRVYELEKTRSRKGYRIIPTLNPNLSAIELSLHKAGFEVYMPCESRLVRDRRHTDLWKPRRFAMFVGYVFVHNPGDWSKLRDVDGVSGVIRNMDGKPLAIGWDDILKLRAVEAGYEAAFHDKSKNARQTLRRKAKDDPRLAKLIDLLDIAGKFTVLPSEQGIAA